MRLIARAHFTPVNMEDGIIDFPIDKYEFKCFFCEKTTIVFKNDFKEGMVINCVHCHRNICIITKTYKRRLVNKRRKKGKKM